MRAFKTKVQSKRCLGKEERNFVTFTPPNSATGIKSTCETQQDMKGKVHLRDLGVDETASN
jgi:hypothetical protein